jgi:hypothetical protein
LDFSIQGGFAQGDIPFDWYQDFRIRDALKKYQTGKYQGRNMITLQAECHWNFYRRWGAVLFAGIGNIWCNENEENDLTFAEQQWLPNAGL